MVRPLGSLNKLTLKKHEQAQRLAKKFGDPVESILQRRDCLEAERAELLALQKQLMAAPSRHRQVKKIAQIESKIDRLDDKVLRHNEAAAPYMRARYQSITYKSESEPSVVVQMPAAVSGSDEWLKKYAPPEALKDVSPGKPKQIEEAKPTMKEFVPNLRAALDVADKIGGNISAQAVIDESRQFAKVDMLQQQVDELNARFMKGY
jgi:hypothetical protein